MTDHDGLISKMHQQIFGTPADPDNFLVRQAVGKSVSKGKSEIFPAQGHAGKGGADQGFFKTAGNRFNFR